MHKTYNLVELFSGIGSQAKALKNLGIKVNTLGTSEWDVHAIAAYDVIHNSPEIPAEVESMSKEQLLGILGNYTFSNSGKEPLDYNSFKTYSAEVLRRIYISILRNKNFVDISCLDGKLLPDDIDILTYSFPCQDLSNVGAFHGYNKGIDKGSGSRSSLLWQVGRILTEMRAAGKHLPRFLLMENVPTLLSKRHSKNFSTWISDLEDLGYISQYYQLNASSFGLPQNRPRLLMISVYVGDCIDDWRLVNEYFAAKKAPEDIIKDFRESEYFVQYSVQELLRINYQNQKIFAEAVECTPNDTESRRKIWQDNPQIILSDGSFNPAIDAVRTITTKQDRNPNSGNLYFDSGIDGRSKFRYLTPRECLLFMGFTDEDYRKLKYNNIEFHKGDALFARDKIIRLAGNSIPVKLLEGVFYQILQIDDMLCSHPNRNKSVTVLFSPESSYSEIIRSYIFKRGIRSRITNEDHPKNATVVYPKYKTAIYVVGCEYQGDSIEGLCEQRYWQRHSDQMFTRAKQCCNEALNMGWNAIFVKNSELSEIRQDQTLPWIVDCLKESEKNEMQGGLIYCG